MSSYQNESTDRLFRVIADIHSPEECRAFFEDLCTIKEIQDMAQRFDTALLLDRGLSYQSIIEKVGISTATISRVNRSLTYGSNGYKTVISRFNEGEDRNEGK